MFHEEEREKLKKLSTKRTESEVKREEEKNHQQKRDTKYEIKNEKEEEGKNPKQTLKKYRQSIRCAYNLV